MSPDLDLRFVLTLAFLLLIPFAIAGLAIINTGLGRSRSAAHAMTSSLCMVSTAVLVYLVLGFAVEGSPHFIFLRSANLPNQQLFAVLRLFSVGLAALIPLGAAADRWKLGAACASTAVLAGLTCPLFLRSISVLNLVSGPAHIFPPYFLDSGGAGYVHVTGGLTALAVVWLLGPRSGKYSRNGVPIAIPAHNGVFVVFGCMLAWLGWLGLNSAGAILNDGAPPEKSVLVVLNTTFAAAAAGLTAAVFTRFRFRKPDASLIANGWMAGLVASSAGCALFKPAIAILVGLVAGMLVVLSVEFFEFTLKVDDPCGSVSVHAVCGIWGLLAVGIFVGGQGELLMQLAGVATLLGLIFPLAYGSNWLLGRFLPYRVSMDGERQGLDLHELGADAYPEFVVHADEFMQR